MTRHWILSAALSLTGCLQVYNSTSGDSASFARPEAEEESEGGQEESGGDPGSGDGTGGGTGEQPTSPAAQRLSAAKAVFKRNSCYKCHADFRSYTDADFGLDDYYVVPGNPASSLILQRVLGQGAIMPQSPDPQLSAADIAILTDWIQNMGAE